MRIKANTLARLTGIVLVSSASIMLAQKATTEGWLIEGPKNCSLVEQQQQSVDNQNIVAIDSTKRMKAVRALRSETSLLLSASQFADLAGQGQSKVPLPIRDETLRPYLVRAVSAAPMNRHFGIHWCHQDLYVFSGSLGGGAPEKDPVIVFLQSKPKKIFTSFADAR